MHIPVLPKQILDFLEPRPGKNFIDGTCGGAGHAVEILKKNGPQGKVLCVDLDKEALERSRKNIEAQGRELLGRAVFAEENFANLEKIVRANDFFPVEGILVDLGMSSDQLELSDRGFSFQKDEALDMRFSTGQELTAAEILNRWDDVQIHRILKEYGEERFARSITAEIIKTRKQKPILRTWELVDAIGRAVPKRFKNARIHFATRTFQALRIAVNDELGSLGKFLAQSLAVLSPGGRIAVISFHSLEDRLVKNFFREKAKSGELMILTKKPVVPEEDEISRNPRSRSAKLRVSQKI